MTIGADSKEESFTLVTSQRKNRRKQKKEFKSIPDSSKEEEDLDEKFVIK